ncbi:MAG: J domain-containing protein [Gemmatimonadota bacterium]
MRVTTLKKPPRQKPVPAVEYDELVYRESLRALGLFAPVTLEEIQIAYRRRAKTYHPDRAAANGNADEATGQMERINLAHGYVVQHFQTFDRARNRSLRRAMAGEPPVRAWQEILLLPITAVYSLALLAAAGPAALLAGASGAPGALMTRPQRLALWAKEKWLLIGPHLLVMGSFVTLEVWGLGPGLLRWWLGLALLVMLASDIASRATGERNPLRQHRAMERLQAFVRG